MLECHKLFDVIVISESYHNQEVITHSEMYDSAHCKGRGRGVIHWVEMLEETLVD